MQKYISGGLMYHHLDEVLEMLTGARLEDRCVAAVRAVLPRSVDVRQPRGDAQSDLVVNGQVIDIKWAGEGQLGDVRPLIALRRHRPDVVVARRLSPGAKAALADAGVGWVDESGAAEIAIGTIIVSRSGAANIRDSRPKGWAPAVLATAEAVLCGVKATAAAVGEATGLSTGSCVNALRVLTDLGLLQASAARGRESARRVSDPDHLLDVYSLAAQRLASDLRLEVGVTWRDLAAGVRAVAHRLGRAGVGYAVSGVLAGDLLAPYLTNVATVDVYVSADTIIGLEAAAADAGLKPVEGGRLVLRPFPTVAVSRLASEAGGLRVAPWPRVYVDLRRAGVRGEDAAEHLREVMRER